MKLLKLDISAFGPFAAQETVDLSLYRGLTLITGPTGAGKTSIFDAMTYALYGKCSGFKEGVRALRSDYAQPQTETYVELTFSCREQVYTLRRAPEYERPRLRGDGLTSQKQEVWLTGPDGSIWTRWSEVNAKAAELVGLDYEQFSQVALIAQGKFMELLHADSRERGAVFRKVFSTGIYKRLADSLSQSMTELNRDYQQQARSIARYGAAVACPEDKPQAAYFAALGQKPEVFDTDELLELLDRLIEEDGQELAIADAGTESLRRELELARAAMEAAEALEQDMDQLEQAQSRLRQLEQEEEQLLPLREELRQGEEAAALEPLRELYRAAKEAAAIAGSQLNQARSELEQATAELKAAQELYQLTQEQKPRLEQLRLRIDQLEREQEVHQKLEQLRGQLQQARALRDGYAQQAAENKSAQSQLLDRLATAGQELEALAQAPLEEERARNMSQQAAQRLAQAQELTQTAVQYRQLDKDWQAEAALSRQARQELAGLIMEHSRLHAACQLDMAGILACELRPGLACPVCGSLDHPQPALPPAGQVSQEQVDQAAAQRDQAREQQQSQDLRTEASRAAAEAAARQLCQGCAPFGLSPEDGAAAAQAAEAILAQQQAAVERAGQELAQAGEKARRYQELREQSQGWQEQLAQTQAREEKLTELLHSQERAADALAAQEAALSQGLALADSVANQEALSQARQELTKLAGETDRAESAFRQAKEKQGQASAAAAQVERQQAQARQNEEKASQEFAQAALAAFGSREDYLAARRSPDIINSLRQRIQEHQSARAGAGELVAALTRRLAGKQRPEGAGLRGRYEELSQAYAGAESKAREVAARLAHNQGQRQAISSALSPFAELRARYGLMRELSETIRGDQRSHNMSFETYVQTAYFQNVMIAANQRLYQMSEGQFELTRKSGGGLELNVLDHHTGVERDVKSLSGGESFMASLSLALGLSDVIRHYAGGVELEVMFIDEGFGSLDPERLRQAVRILSQLAADDRLVGIISHMAELRESIPRQIVVEKTLRGSHILS